MLAVEFSTLLALLKLSDPVLDLGVISCAAEEKPSAFLVLDLVAMFRLRVSELLLHSIQQDQVEGFVSDRLAVPCIPHFFGSLLAGQVDDVLGDLVDLGHDDHPFNDLFHQMRHLNQPFSRVGDWDDSVLFGVNLLVLGLNPVSDVSFGD